MKKIYFVFKNYKNIIYTYLFSFLIFSIPSNLFIKFFENQAYSNGIFVDYLIPKLFISDLIILLIFIVFLVEKFNKKLVVKFKNTQILYTLFFILVLLIPQFFAPHQISIYSFFKLAEFGILAFILYKKRKHFKNKLIQTSLTLTLLLQSLLAIYQYHFQKHLFGFWFWGEPILSNPIGLAKTTINGVEKILPYGTTAHPNILAGFIAISIFLLLQLIKVNHNKVLNNLSKISILISLYPLYLTGSISAWLSLILMMGYFLNKPHIDQRIKQNLNKILLFFFLSTFFFIGSLKLFERIYPDSLSITRRNSLNYSALEMIIDHPLLGVGMGNFVTNLENYSYNQEVIRFIQPVHHTVLLIMSENGLLGLLISYLFYLMLDKKIRIKLVTSLILLLPIISLDHYLWTIQSGSLLFILLIVSSLI